MKRHSPPLAVCQAVLGSRVLPCTISPAPCAVRQAERQPEAHNNHDRQSDGKTYLSTSFNAQSVLDYPGLLELVLLALADISYAAINPRSETERKIRQTLLFDLCALTGAPVLVQFRNRGSPE